MTSSSSKLVKKSDKKNAKTSIESTDSDDEGLSRGQTLVVKDDVDSKDVVSLASLAKVGKLLTTRAMLRDGLRSKARHFVRSKKNSKTGDEYLLPVIATLDITTTSGGVYSVYTGGNIFTVASDWTALTSLFDLVRCRRVRIHYEPRAGNSSVSVSGSTTLIHQPMMMCGDDDAVVNLSFATLTNTRDLDDRRNRFCSTNSRATLNFSVKPSSNRAPTTPVASIANMAVWQDTNAMPTAPGGALIAVRTDTVNNAVNLGVMHYVFEVEWSTRI